MIAQAPDANHPDYQRGKQLTFLLIRQLLREHLDPQVAREGSYPELREYISERKGFLAEVREFAIAQGFPQLDTSNQFLNGVEVAITEFLRTNTIQIPELPI